MRSGGTSTRCFKTEEERDKFLSHVELEAPLPDDTRFWVSGILELGHVRHYGHFVHFITEVYEPDYCI